MSQKLVLCGCGGISWDKILEHLPEPGRAEPEQEEDGEVGEDDAEEEGDVQGGLDQGGDQGLVHLRFASPWCIHSFLPLTRDCFELQVLVADKKRNEMKSSDESESDYQTRSK